MEHRALLFANGCIAGIEHIQQLIQPGDTLIAVDGGYRLMKKLGLVPHILIGDLDSISKRNLQKIRSLPTEIIRFQAQKDESDLELALILALNRGFTEIIIIGGMGGRSDHALVNLSLLLRSSDQVHIRLDDGREEINLVRSEFIIQGDPGDIVSLIPFGQKVEGARTTGLDYALNGETLFPDQSRGLSNIMKSKKATVTLKEGCLLCFHQRLKGMNHEN